MPAIRSAAHEKRLGVPVVLLSICLLALLVSLFDLFRTSSITQTRFDDLHMSWQTLMEDGVDGAEVVLTDRLMQSVLQPLPAVLSAARWSFAMGGLSLVFFAWLLVSVRSSRRGRISSENQHARSDEAAMARLLDEMAPLASGDLSVSATVRDGMVGALADAFNHAISELQRLAGIQLSTSRAIGDSVNQSHELAVAIEQQCSQQTWHIHQSSNLLMGMSSSTGLLSANTAETSIATKVLMDKANSAATALTENARQIDSMRQNSSMSVRLMQSLGQHAVSIDNTLSLLEDLAQRTDLLAVNTTIRASSEAADVAVSDVRRLSDEVARLAEAFSRATAEIGAITCGIKADTSEAITCMRQLQVACDAQYIEMRSLAGAQVQISTHSQTMHTHALHMADQAFLHAGVVKNLSDNMNLINQITEKTGQKARSNAVSNEALKKLANDLRQSTSDFNLPDSCAASTEGQRINSVVRRTAERAAING